MSDNNYFTSYGENNSLPPRGAEPNRRPETAYELELQMRLLLDAAMRYRHDWKDPDLTEDERASIRSWWIRDTEVWMGNCGYYDVVQEALYRALHRLSDELLILLDDPDEHEEAIQRLAGRGPGGHYQRFCFYERP